MSEWWKNSDPHAAEEASRYARPVPSRQLIMQFLEQRGAPASHRVLCREMEVRDEEQQQALLFRLKAMVRDGQLLQNRKGAFALLSKLDLIKGRIQGNREGYGFLIPDEGGDDLYLSPREMRQLFDGDRALVRESGIDRRGRREGQVVEVLERNTVQVVGRYYEESGTAFVTPENPRISRDILVKSGPLMPVPGQYVLLEILDQPGRRALPVGLVKEIMGERGAAGMEVEVALRSHNIPHAWPEAVTRQCSRFSQEVLAADKTHRVDLRDRPFVTIDGEDARDFDDAVYCEKKRSGGWRLFVAIADVSHYVRPGSALDEEARERGTSVYFPGHVVPMLPEVLSNGLCSLNPDVDRLAMVCEMTISARGKLSGYRFYEGLIRSHARLTYTQVWAMLASPLGAEGQALRAQRQPLVSHLDNLYSLYQVLHQVRESRGAIDFDTVETRIVFGAERKIDRIVATTRNEAHRLIEECMLCANVSAARFLEKHGLAGLFRVHEGPTMEKRLNLNSFLGSLGLAVPSGKIKPRDIQGLMAQVQGRADFHVIQTVVLRSMSQAVYAAENKGHFGLAFNAYTHFTSPIRRYPDLLVHRAIRHVIRSDQDSPYIRRVEGARPLAKKAIYPYDSQAIEALGAHCSRTERRADEATRDATDWLKCEYMQQHLGQTFRGVVSSVTGFGLFVELKDIFVEGLVHISSLPGDYYHFDAVHHCLRGEKTGRQYRLGDELDVLVARVNLDDRKIDFEPASAPSKGVAARSAGAARGESSGATGRSRSAAARARLIKEAQQSESKAGKKSRGNKKRRSGSAEKNSGQGKAVKKNAKKKAKPSAKKSGNKKPGKKPGKKGSQNTAVESTGRQPRKRKISG